MNSTESTVGQQHISTTNITTRTRMGSPLPLPRCGIYGLAKSNAGIILRRGRLRTICLGFISYGKIKTLLIYFYRYSCFQQIACPPSTIVAESVSIVAIEVFNKADNPIEDSTSLPKGTQGKKLRQRRNRVHQNLCMELRRMRGVRRHG